MLASSLPMLVWLQAIMLFICGIVAQFLNFARQERRVSKVRGKELYTGSNFQAAFARVGRLASLPGQAPLVYFRRFPRR